MIGGGGTGGIGGIAGGVTVTVGGGGTAGGSPTGGVTVTVGGGGTAGGSPTGRVDATVDAVVPTVEATGAGAGAAAACEGGGRTLADAVGWTKRLVWAAGAAWRSLVLRVTTALRTGWDWPAEARCCPGRTTHAFALAAVGAAERVTGLMLS